MEKTLYFRIQGISGDYHVRYYDNMITLSKLLSAILVIKNIKFGTMKFRGERYHGHKNCFCSTGSTLHVFLWWNSSARRYSCCCLLLQYANGHFSSIVVDLSALGRKGENFCIVLKPSKATSEFYLLLNACRVSSEHVSIFRKNQACDSLMMW